MKLILDDWIIREVIDTLYMARTTFLGITGLDSPQEIEKKSANETAITRRISKAIDIIQQSEQSPLPNDLEEAARKYQESVPVDTTIHYCGADEDVYFANRIVDAVIVGANWQKEQDEKEQADLFTIVALDAAERAKKKMIEDFPKWRKIKAGERLPCPAYVWTTAYDNYPDCFEGRLMPNIQGVKVGRDTWYLPVDVIHNLPKED